MVHHLGIGVVAAALMGAFLLPPSCNPLKGKEGAPVAQVQVEAAPAQELALEDAARLYLTDLYSRDPGRIRRALSPNAGSVGVTDPQVAAAIQDNQTRPPPREVVIVRQEVQHVPPQGHSASVWFVLVRPDASTQTGRLSGWRRHGGNWVFTVTGY